MATITRKQYDEDVRNLPQGMTEQGYVRGLVRNGHQIEGLNLQQNPSYLETSDPSKYSTQDLQNVIGKPEGMIGAVGKGILGGVVGAGQTAYNIGRNAYNAVNHPLDTLVSFAALPAGAIESGLAAVTDPFLSPQHQAPMTWERQQFQGLMKGSGISDVASGVATMNPSKVLAGVDTGINFAYQNPDVAALTAEGAARGINKMTGSNITTPLEAGGQLVQSAKFASGKVGNYLHWKTPTPNLDASIKDSINTALRPSVMKTDAQARKYYENATTAVKDIASNKDFLELQDPNGGFMNKGSLPDSLETMKQANLQMKSKLFGQWDTLTKMASGKGAEADVQPIVDKYIEFANDEIIQTQYPELASWAETKATAFSNLGTMKPEQLQTMIQNMNAELDAYYKNPNPNDVSKTAVIAAVKNTANDVLSGMVEKQAVPAQYSGIFSELKKKYAAQKAIEADLNRRATVFARANPQSVLDFSNILTARDAVQALSRLDMGALARGAATKVMTAWMKEQNNPNAMIKKMFQKVDTHIQSSSESPILMRAQQAVEQGAAKPAAGNTINGLDTLPKDILNPSAGQSQVFKSGKAPVKTQGDISATDQFGRTVDLSSVNNKTNPSVTMPVEPTPLSQQAQTLATNLQEPSPNVNVTPEQQAMADAAPNLSEVSAAQIAEKNYASTHSVTDGGKAAAKATGIKPPVEIPPQLEPLISPALKADTPADFMYELSKINPKTKNWQKFVDARNYLKESNFADAFDTQGKLEALWYLVKGEQPPVRKLFPGSTPPTSGNDLIRLEDLPF